MLFSGTLEVNYNIRLLVNIINRSNEIECNWVMGMAYGVFCAPSNLSPENWRMEFSLHYL